MVDLAEAEQWIHWLWRLKNGLKTVVLCGDGWGDNGKRAIESVLESFFDMFVRVSGGCNTGGTHWLLGKDGAMHEFIRHQLPSCWPNRTGVIGHWVLLNLERLVGEIRAVVDIVGEVKADLFISKEAPLYLPYYSLLEAYSEVVRGAGAVGTTKRGIAHTIAAVDLREGPLVAYLQHPQWLLKWVTNVFKQHEASLRAYEEMCKGTKDEFDLNRDYNPKKVTEELLVLVSKINDYIQDVGPILLDYAKRNRPVLYGLTQGFGLFRLGTYPFNSSGQVIASAAAYCQGMPMAYFGAIILVSKLILTRVGAGPFPTGWWHREAAELFPKKYPWLFSVLKEHDREKRTAFIKARRDIINSGAYTDEDLALLMQVLLNNLGATTKRGREPGAPDLYQTACAAAVNGADVIALTQADVLEGLKMNFPFGTQYLFNGKPFQVPVMPRPVELMKDPRFSVLFDHIPVDLVGQQLYGKSELPPVFDQICKLYEEHTGTPIGIISTSPKGKEGKVFRQPAK